MDPRTGEIFTPEHIEALAKLPAEEEQRKLNRLIKMNIPPTPEQMKRRPPKVGRNEPCPCGSGKKFKKCCLE